MKELSVGEQRYQAVMAVLSGGRTVTEGSTSFVRVRLVLSQEIGRVGVCRKPIP